MGKMAAKILLLFLVANAAEGKNQDFSSACPSMKELKKYIFICGDNAYATKKAKECSELVLSTWESAAVALTAGLSGAADSQKTGLANAANDYQKTVQELDRQIAMMQKYTSMIADYTLPMMDDPTSKDDSGSLDCFNSEFHAIQKIVDKLDDEIIRAKDLRDQAKALQGASTAGAKGLADLRSSLGAASAAVGKGRQELSVVTGSAEKELLEAGKTGSPGAQSGITAVDSLPSAGPMGRGDKSDFAGSSEKGNSRAAGVRQRFPSTAAESGASGVLPENMQEGFLNPAAASAQDGAGAASRAGILPESAVGEAAVKDMLRFVKTSKSPMAAGGKAGGAESGSQSALLASEESLFVAVTRRYRASDLFQNAGKR
jgi:hypothetical protein